MKDKMMHVFTGIAGCIFYLAKQQADFRELLQAELVSQTIFKRLNEIRVIARPSGKCYQRIVWYSFILLLVLQQKATSFRNKHIIYNA